MEFLILGFVFLFGSYFGWTFREKVASYHVKKLLESLEEDEEESTVMKIVIEKHNDTLFAYEKETSAFITQAKDREELEKKLSEVYPGKSFGVTPKNLIEIGFI
jgi:hypothetical protein